MERLKIFAGLAVLFVSVSAAGSEAGEPDRAWVAIDFQGGKQCEPDSKYDPPDVKQLLGRAGINVYKTSIEHTPRLAMCGGPTYSATHYARIPRNQIYASQKMGFYLPPISPEAMKAEKEKQLQESNRRLREAEAKAKADRERESLEDIKRP